MITRGCSATHFFTIPYDESDVSEIYVVYVQDGEVRIQKDKSEMIIFEDEEGNTTLQVDLTPTDTKCFKPVPPIPRRTLIAIQLVVKMNNGTTTASEIARDRLGVSLQEDFK